MAGPILSLKLAHADTDGLPCNGLFEPEPGDETAWCPECGAVAEVLCSANRLHPTNPLKPATCLRLFVPLSGGVRGCLVHGLREPTLRVVGHGSAWGTDALGPDGLTFGRA